MVRPCSLRTAAAKACRSAAAKSSAVPRRCPTPILVKGGASIGASTAQYRYEPSAGDGLEHALGDVEIRVDVLHVVVVLERVDQAQDLLRSALVRDLDCRLRDHRQLG